MELLRGHPVSWLVFLHYGSGNTFFQVVHVAGVCLYDNLYVKIRCEIVLQAMHPFLEGNYIDKINKKIQQISVNKLIDPIIR